MMYHVSVESMMETNFSLMQFHKWSLSDIENLIPWEREVYVKYLVNYLEKQRLEAQQAQNANINAQPQTPMLSAPQSSTMDRALRTLQRNQANQLEQREVNNPIQRLSLEVEQINNSMKIMQEEMHGIYVQDIF